MVWTGGFPLAGAHVPDMVRQCVYGLGGWLTVRTIASFEKAKHQVVLASVRVAGADLYRRCAAIPLLAQKSGSTNNVEEVSRWCYARRGEVGRGAAGLLRRGLKPRRVDLLRWQCSPSTSRQN